MSLWDCIQQAADAGHLDPRRARAAQELYRERLQAHAHLGPGADVAAAEDVWVKLRTDFQRRKRGNLMQIDASQRIIEQVTGYRDASGKENAARALNALLEWDQNATFENVSSIQDALTGRYRRMVNDFLEAHKRDVLGRVTNKAGERDLAEALHGGTPANDSVADLAEAVSKTFEQARGDFNAAGGSIGALDDFGLPHKWNREAMRAATFEKWAADIAPRLDWDRMVDFETGRPFRDSSPEAREAFLREIYDGITTDGWNKREPSGIQLGRSTANARSDSRVLHFKSGGDWYDINKIYGTASVFETVVTHLDGMARDTAMMRILGPNPKAGLEMARQTALKLAQDRPWKPSWLYSDAAEEVGGKFANAQRMLDLINGSANVPEMGKLAKLLSGTRHYLIASQLGGAMLSAVTDVGFMTMASHHVGMSGSKVMKRHMKLMASKEGRSVAARAGVIADSVANVGVVQSRLMGEAYGPAIAERLSEFTMRASGLNIWTDSARSAFRLQFYGFLAENSAKAWDDLPDPFRRLVFEARGITKDEWDIIRKTPLMIDGAEPDATFLIPDDIRHRTDIDPDLADALSLKLEAAIREQVEFAVPSASLRGRAMASFAPGSLLGEISRSGLMYKSFVMSLMFNQLGRVLFSKVNGSRAANIAMFATLTTVAGAVSLQLKDIAKGRDPRPMDSPGFLLAAQLQGGGLGILGDFIYASQNRFGQGLAQTVAGPGVGLLQDGTTLTGSLIGAMTSNDENAWGKAGRTAVKFANRYSGPTNLWYGNLAIDRMVWDNLQEALDPEAQTAFRRAEKRHVNAYRNPSWWLSGDGSPMRAPDLSNILGGNR